MKLFEILVVDLPCRVLLERFSKQTTDGALNRAHFSLASSMVNRCTQSKILLCQDFWETFLQQEEKA